MAEIKKVRRVGARASHMAGRVSPHVKKAAHHSARVVRHGARKSVQAARVVHHHVVVRPHSYALGKWAWYARWHNWRWHRVTQVGTLTAYFAVMGVIVFNAFNLPSSALSTWTQTNWDGGAGTSTSNQYESLSNIDATTANQLTLAKGSNAFTNSTFDSNVTGWNGYNRAYDNTQSYSASGSAKITAGSVSTNAFYGHVTTSTVANQFKTASGDINGDGIDDIVVTTFVAASNEVRLYFGQGDGTYSSATILTTPTTLPYDAVIGDFTGDGWNDVLVTEATASGTNKVAYFVNNGSGTLSAPSEIAITGGPIGGTRGCTVKKGYIDNNGSLDAAFICNQSSSAFVFLNNGSGTFIQTAYSTGYGLASSQPFALTDINGDGRPEIIIQNSTGICSMYILPNNGSGLFGSVATYTIATQCGNGTKYGIAGGDVNNDGYGDIALARRSGTGGTSTSDTYYVSVFLGNASNSFSSQVDYAASSGVSSSTIMAEITDFNGDGYKEIIVSFPSNNVLGYYKNNGDGTFAAKVDYAAGTTPGALTLTDTNTDGKSDVVVINVGSNNFSTFINRTPGDAITQVVNVGDTNSYHLEAYVYTTGAAVTDADAQLYYNGDTISTTYALSSTPGWYKLSGTLTGANDKRNFGVVAKQGKTVYVDNMNLYKYSNSGYVRSAVFDPGFGGDWSTMSFSSTNSSGVSVKVRTADNSGMSGATAFSGCTAISSGSDITSNGCVTDGDQYIQYEVTLTPVSNETPVFSSFALNYSAYDVLPPDTNAADILMYKANGGSLVSENGWTNGSSPYFTWTAGSDNAGGTGLLGYCVYLGTDNTADPVTTKGILGTSPISNAACPFIVDAAELDLSTAGLLGTALSTSNTAYYVSVKAVDAVGNVYTGGSEQFHFKFDNTAPSNPAYLSAPSQFLNTKTATITWPSSGDGVAADANAGLAGLQYKINSSPWYGDDHTGAGDINDVLANDGSYVTIPTPDFDNITDGINTFYMRTWDNAGNVTTSYVTAALKVNTNNSPSEPQNVTATPSTNTSNSFAFSWAAPASFVGSASSLTYCYTINVVPSALNCSFTAGGVTSLSADAYATQPGSNIFYVVAKDESGNINYSSYASDTFTANTPAPGMPASVDIADVSIKASSNWRLALTWEEPSDTGAGIASYKILRSTDNNTFTQVGTSTNTSYVDGGLTQQEYFYQIKACDSANQCSAVSATVSDTPTGKFTTPATLVSEAVVSDITTKRATITWSTDRASDSKIQIGTTSGSYSPSEVGNSSQVTGHTIELDNLAAGTTYYFRARWTDEDGNTGTSQEYSFTTAPAPMLKEVSILSVGLSTATVQFTVKDSAKVAVQYGKTDAFGGVKTINTSMTESTYEVELVGLDDGAKYLYRMIMTDSENGSYQSTIFSFNTPARPKISNLRFQPLTGEPTSTQQVTWETNIPTTSSVDYGVVGTAGTTSQSAEMKTTHEIIIRGLQDNSEYFLLAAGRDINGNLATSDRQIFKTALDTRPPTVSDIVIEPSIRGTGTEARGQIVVSWKTDEPSTSQVAYGDGSAVTVFNNRTAEDAQLTTEHLVIISDLPPSRVYSIMPVSRDKSSNASTTKPQAAIIGRASDSVLNIVLGTLRKVFGL